MIISMKSWGHIGDILTYWGHLLLFPFFSFFSWFFVVVGASFSGYFHCALSHHGCFSPNKQYFLTCWRTFLFPGTCSSTLSAFRCLDWGWNFNASADFELVLCYLIIANIRTDCQIQKWRKKPFNHNLELHVLSTFITFVHSVECLVQKAR